MGLAWFGEGWVGGWGRKAVAEGGREAVLKSHEMSQCSGGWGFGGWVCASVVVGGWWSKA